MFTNSCPMKKSRQPPGGQGLLCSMSHVPEKSGLPSAVFGAGAARFGNPSEVLGTRGNFIERSHAMRRAYVLAGMLGAGSLSLVLVASQQPPAAAGQPPAPMVVEVEKLKDNLFMLKGGGGNTAVFVTSSGVVVVDTKNPGWGKPILEKIKG